MQAGKYNKPKIENFKKLNLYLAKVEQIKKIKNEYVQRNAGNPK